MKNTNNTAQTATRTLVIQVQRALEKKDTFFSEQGPPVQMRSAEARLEEAVGLAKAINLDIRHAQFITLRKNSPATLLTKGHLENFACIVADQDIELVVCDATLSPVQQRNLEKALKTKVIDRTGVILEIFGDRARTAEGRLQVDLACLSYQRSRLVRSWTHLERQRGGFGFMGGPGEAQIELDRRMLDERIAKLKKQLEHTKRTRRLHRDARKRVPSPVVALVGYTNAGKSTLFNHLTRAEVFAEDLLFATLDPTMRRLKLPSGREIILSDTVGFISDLPTPLIAAFRATLEEVTSADLILHVQDCAHPDSAAQAEDVHEVLRELGLSEALERNEIMDIYNKMDLLPTDQKTALRNQLARNSAAIGISALKNEGLEDVTALIDHQLSARRKTLTIKIPIHRGDILAWLYRRGAIQKRTDHEEYISLVLTLDASDIEPLNKRLKSLKR